jgi:hypothetical protein
MRSHNPKRLIITAVATLAVAGAALLPGVASADGGPKPRPQGPATNGIWVPQGSPLLGTTYGGDGQTKVFEREQDAEIRQPQGRAPTRIVDAADYVI